VTRFRRTLVGLKYPMRPADYVPRFAFQTYPRGVEVAAGHVRSLQSASFQTYPRGVEVRNACTQGLLPMVSDVPSWG